MSNNAMLPDTDTLPLTQHLVMEVLAARWRLGEAKWTLDRRTGRALAALAQAGYLNYKSGIVERTYLAWMTPEGVQAATSDAYMPPRPDRACICDDLLALVADALAARAGTPGHHVEARELLSRLCAASQTSTTVDDLTAARPTGTSDDPGASGGAA